MKKLMVFAALASLAACSKQEPAPTADATESAAPAATSDADAAAAQPVAADGKPSVGTFTVTTSDGKVFTEEDKADGTYVDTKDGKVVETGKWEQKSPSQFCFTKDEANAKQQCNTEQVDAKGVWTSVGPDGKTATVVRTGG